MICVLDKSATLSETCPELCCKVGVMEFGLNYTSTQSDQLPKSGLLRAVVAVICTTDAERMSILSLNQQ